MTDPSPRAKSLENLVSAVFDRLHDSPETEPETEPKTEPNPEPVPKPGPIAHDPHFLVTDLKHYLDALGKLAGEANEIYLDGDDLFCLFHTGSEKAERALEALERS